MQTLRTTHGVYTLSPTRNVGELQAKFAKITGKTKRSTIKADKRHYPEFFSGMSTAEYVRRFNELNTTLRPYARAGSVNAKRQAAESLSFYAPLNAEPCTLYSGEDSHEIVECDVIEFPQPELLAA